MNQLPKNINWPLVLFALFFFGPILGKLLIPILIGLAAYSGFKYLSQNSNSPNIINIKNTVSKAADSIKNNNMTTIDPKLDDIKKKFSLLILAVLAIWLFTASIYIVDAGKTGVYKLFGRVSDKELSSGFKLVLPVAQVIQMSIRTEEYTMSVLQDEGERRGADAISALTKEGLSVDLDMTVFYRLNEENASDIYTKVGLNYKDKIIRPEIRSAIRAVIANYEAKDIYSEKRQEAAQNILKTLETKLNTRGIIVEDVLIRNVKLPSGLAESIQQKLQAEQEAQRYDFILDKEKKEKERKIIEAEGQEEAQKIINQSLTTNYLYYLYVNQLKDREGTIYVPTSPSTGMPLFRDIGK